MPANPTNVAFTYIKSNNIDDDFLQLIRTSDGKVLSWVDSSGTLQGVWAAVSGGGGANPSGNDGDVQFKLGTNLSNAAGFDASSFVFIDPTTGAFSAETFNTSGGSVLQVGNNRVEIDGAGISNRVNLIAGETGGAVIIGSDSGGIHISATGGDTGVGADNNVNILAGLGLNLTSGSGGITAAATNGGLVFNADQNISTTAGLAIQFNAGTTLDLVANDHILTNVGGHAAIELTASALTLGSDNGSQNISIGTSSGDKIGFFNATPISKPTITGSRGGNAALASLLTQLATAGLITDSTSA